MSLTTAPNSRINHMASGFYGYMRSFACPGYADAEDVEHQCGATVTTNHRRKLRCDLCAKRKENAAALRLWRSKHPPARDLERKEKAA